MKQSLYWLILLAGLMAGQIALSENDEDLEAVRAGVRQIGKQFNPRVLAATRDLYLPLQKQAFSQKCTLKQLKSKRKTCKTQYNCIVQKIASKLEDTIRSQIMTKAVALEAASKKKK